MIELREAGYDDLGALDPNHTHLQFMLSWKKVKRTGFHVNFNMQVIDLLILFNKIRERILSI